MSQTATTLDHERSSIQIHSPDSSTFRIEHKDPHWRLERTHVFGEHSDTLSLELTTDGEPVTFTRNGWEMHARMSWDGEALVLNSTMSREDQKLTNIVRYRLEDGGQTFIAEEHMESEQESHDNLWVFTRSAEAGT